MKKVHLSLISVLFTLLLFCASFNSNAQPKTFNQVYQTALELNENRFEDLDYILVGDTVLLPSLSGPGVVAWIADERDIVTGRHDCIWIIAEKYLEGTLVTVPADTIQVAVPTPVVITTPDEAKAGFPWILIFLIIIIILAVILFSYIPSLRRRLEKKINEKNPDSYPPVGADLDKASDEELIRAFTSMLKPGERIISVERGTLKRVSGPKRIYVEMEFGDGVNRKVFMVPDERVSRAKVQIRDYTFDIHARTICANGMILDNFKLPDGWVFQSDNKVIKVDTPVVEVTDTEETEESTTETSEVDKTNGSPVVKRIEKNETGISAEKLKVIAELVGKVVSETETGDISLQMKDLTLKVIFSGKKSEKNEPIKERLGKVSEIIN